MVTPPDRDTLWVILGVLVLAWVLYRMVYDPNEWRVDTRTKRRR